MLLLVGNSGSGNILADQKDGSLLVELKLRVIPVEIEALWSIMYYQGDQNRNIAARLYFTGGTGNGKQGFLATLKNN